METELINMELVKAGASVTIGAMLAAAFAAALTGAFIGAAVMLGELMFAVGRWLGRMTGHEADAKGRLTLDHDVIIGGNPIDTTTAYGELVANDRKANDRHAKTAPSRAREGDRWLDTSVHPPQLRVLEGGKWVDAPDPCPDANDGERESIRAVIADGLAQNRDPAETARQIADRFVVSRRVE